MFAHDCMIPCFHDSMIPCFHHFNRETSVLPEIISICKMVEDSTEDRKLLLNSMDSLVQSLRRSYEQDPAGANI